MQWNHSEPEYKYPTHLVPLANMFIEKVQYSRTCISLVQCKAGRVAKCPYNWKHHTSHLYGFTRGSVK